MTNLGGGRQPPRYDAHAAWYDDYVHGAATEHTARTAEALSVVVGSGRGVCLDVGAGPESMQPLCVRSGGRFWAWIYHRVS